MLRSKTARILILLVALVIAVVLVVACGGGQASTPAPSATTQAPANPSLLVTPGPRPSPGGVGPTFEAPSTAGPTTMVQPQSAPVQSGPVSFSKDLVPVIKQQCGSCHIDQSLGGLSLKDYSSLVKGGQNGSPVAKGNADGSLLVRKLRGDPSAGGRMPPSSALADSAIKQFADWVNQGAQNN